MKKSRKVTIAIYTEFGTILDFPMKINLLTPALVAFLGLALAGATSTAQAQSSTNAPATNAPTAVTTMPMSGPAKVMASKSTRYSGTITAIDATSVTIANTQKTLTLAITPQTKFKKNKIVATLADFAVGDKVSGSYFTDATGAMTAKSIYKKTSMAPATSTAAPATPAATPAPAMAPATTQ